MNKTWIDEFYELNPNTFGNDESNKKEKEHKLDLFNVVLPALDCRDKHFYGQCSDEEKKELGKQIWLLTRWMSSTKGNAEHYLLMTNDIVNKNSGDLKKHPELQWQLLALCGVGKSQFHQWVAPSKGIKKDRIEETILKINPLLKDDELELLLSINTVDEIIEFFEDNGYTDEDFKEIFKGKDKSSK